MIANRNENVTLTMTEIERKDSEIVWKKDGTILFGSEENRTELTLLNVSEASSGIYSLEYASSSDRFGFMQLIVRSKCICFMKNYILFTLYEFLLQ